MKNEAKQLSPKNLNIDEHLESNCPLTKIFHQVVNTVNAHGIQIHNAEKEIITLKNESKECAEQREKAAMAINTLENNSRFMSIIAEDIKRGMEKLVEEVSGIAKQMAEMQKENAQLHGWISVIKWVAGVATAAGLAIFSVKIGK